MKSLITDVIKGFDAFVSIPLRRAAAGTGAAEKVEHVVLEMELAAPSAASRGPTRQSRLVDAVWGVSFVAMLVLAIES